MPRGWLMRGRARRWRGPWPAALIVGVALAGCSTATLAPPAAAPPMPALVVAAPAVVVDINLLPGKWGLASYRDEKDKARTLAEAKAACGNPYVIAKGPTGGVLMHLPDQAQPTELFVKVTADGKSFIGPKGTPGMAQDRVVIFFQGGQFISEWVDASARERYGTMLFVRCS